jgi:hypothetical protein
MIGPLPYSKEFETEPDKHLAHYLPLTHLIQAEVIEGRRFLIPEGLLPDNGETRLPGKPH